MYFERWGLLAPPPGKVNSPKNRPALLFPQGYYSTMRRENTTSGVRRAGVQACKKLSVTAPSTKAYDTYHLDFTN